MHYFKLISVLLLVFTSMFSYAQLNNRVLERTQSVEPDYANQIRTRLHVFGFSKNNEYFNKIADGYTLFGYHMSPSVLYYPTRNMRIEGGVFAWKDFGSSGFQNVQPIFSVKVQKDWWAFTFGTLEGNVSHRYIEPLYDFERVITNRLENGMQFQAKTNFLKFDAWVDWNKMIYVGDPNLEEVTGGISASLNLLSRPGSYEAGDSLTIRLPLQFVAQHKGGQIDKSEQPLLTVVNPAVGLEIEKQFISGIVHRVYTKNYLVGFGDFSHERVLPFERGKGVYLNAGLDTKYQDVMLSYWKGDGYIAEYGGQLFQSASRTYKHPDYMQQERELLILRLTKDIELIDHLYLTLRLEPVLDLDTPALEFSNSLFLTFDTDFFVAKPKR